MRAGGGSGAPGHGVCGRRGGVMTSRGTVSSTSGVRLGGLLARSVEDLIVLVLAWVTTSEKVRKVWQGDDLCLQADRGLTVCS